MNIRLRWIFLATLLIGFIAVFVDMGTARACSRGAGYRHPSSVSSHHKKSKKKIAKKNQHSKHKKISKHSPKKSHSQARVQVVDTGITKEELPSIEQPVPDFQQDMAAGNWDQ